MNELLAFGLGIAAGGVFVYFAYRSGIRRAARDLERDAARIYHLTRQDYEELERTYRERRTRKTSN